MERLFFLLKMKNFRKYSLVLEQKVPFKNKAKLFLLIFVLVLFLVVNHHHYYLFLLLLPALILFGGYSFQFNKNLQHKVLITVFGVVIFKYRKSFIQPDYISLFHQSFKETSDFEVLAFGEDKWKSYTIKFFNSNKNEVVFVSDNREKVLNFGKQLSELLNVELYNKIV